MRIGRNANFLYIFGSVETVHTGQDRGLRDRFGYFNHVIKLVDLLHVFS